VLAIAVEALFAEVVVSSAARRGSAADARAQLVVATVARFHRDLAPGSSSAETGLRTTIPRSVGLGGSSAIVIAALRALCMLHDVDLPPAAMAELALSIEVDDLGIAAGLQDRGAQCHGGLTFMEFGVRPPRYERLDPAGLPPLLVAWLAGAAGHSGDVHAGLRARFEAGDGAVRSAMAKLAQAARTARAALRTGDRAVLRACADASFDLRASMMELDPRHVALVLAGRAAGAAVNYTGSGGAVVCICDDERHREAVAAALTELGCGLVAVDP
jgi:glucuronokinase